METNNIKLIGRTLQINGRVVAKIYGSRDGKYGYKLANGMDSGSFYAYFKCAVRDARNEVADACIRDPMWAGELTPLPLSS